MAHRKLIVSVPVEMIEDPGIVMKITGVVPSVMQFQTFEVGPVSAHFYFVRRDKRMNISIAELVRRVERVLRVEHIRIGGC